MLNLLTLMSLHMSISHTLITQLVTLALDEDLNYQSAQDGDITAQLIPQNEHANAKVITREDCVFCGKDIIIEVFKQVDSWEWVTYENETESPIEFQEVSANQF